MSLYEYIHKWGRNCLQCGSFRAGDSLFCQSCERKLIQSAQSKAMTWPVREGFINGLCYFTWIPNKNRPLSLLIEGLKGGRLKKAWQFWATQLVTSFPTDFPTLLQAEFQNPVIVPGPRPKTQDCDHALVFAQSLGNLTGWKIKDCLQKESAQSQKGLGKLERQLIELSSSEIFSDDQAVIFVDDVVTTGATAKAAYLALGKPKKFFVLALACRES